MNTHTPPTWETICPPLFRETDPEKLPPAARAVLDTAMEWTPAQSPGLGFTGQTGTGKSRLAFLMLHKLHAAGISVEAIHSHWLNEMAFKRLTAEDEQRVAAAGALLIEDVDSPTDDQRLNAILEARIAAGRITVWTSGCSLDRLAAASPAKADAARILMHSTIFNLDLNLA